MSLGAGFRSIYDEIRNLRLKPKDSMTGANLQSMPNISQQRNRTIQRTQSRDRSSVGMWRDARCCCQQRVNESERVRRKVAEENAELRRLCIYLDNERQQALSELNQWRNGRQVGSCWYSDPTYCGSNCEVFRCPVNQTNTSHQKSNSPTQQQNDELLAYIRSLEERILTLEEGKAVIHQNGVLLGKTRRPIRSVSQQHSPISSTPTSTTRDFTLQPSSQSQQQIHLLDSSQSTLTDSGTTYYSSSGLDESDDEEEDLSDVTTIYVAAKRASNAANNLDNFINQVSQQNEHSERSTAGLVKKFLSTRETFLQALRKRNDLNNGPDLGGYAIIQRKNKEPTEHSWNDSYLPPALPKLVMRRKFTAENPINDGVKLSRQVA